MVRLTRGGNVNENDFFREFTFRICGSLNIAEALWHCLLYARTAIPADELMLTVFDRRLGDLEVVAHANEREFHTRSDRIHLAPDLRRELEDVEHYRRVRVCNDVRQDPIMEKVADHYGWPDSSVIVGRLIIQHRFIGSLIARAKGKGIYGDEDEALWSLVNEPAGIALANSRQYAEVLRLKDALADDNQYLHNELRRNMGTEIVGAGFGLKGVMEQVHRVAPMSSPVLLIGETGTGKEIIANAIHNLSPRNGGPLVTVNCGAIPESLIDSELFGHEKGSFTGALTERKGRFERADRGTIFLDEVGELPPQAQVRLLRVLQEKEIERVGGSQAVKVDIRIISATHRDLERMVAEGQFRDDLYYRLAVYPIRIPSLRERRSDIPALVAHFVDKKAREMGFRAAPSLAKGTIDLLLRCEWPGNVREVANVVERALIQSRDGILNFSEVMPGPYRKTGILQESPATPPMTTVAARERSAPETEDLRLEQIEALHIGRVIEMTGGKIEGKSGAAVILGMNPATLRHRMRKLGVSFNRKRKE